jgi:hypothetical protein
MKLGHTKVPPWAIWIAAIGPFAVWLAYLATMSLIYCSLDDRGKFGDTFGGLAALFSVMAFAGVLFSLYRDHKEREWRSQVDGYNSLLTSLEHQFDATKSLGADSNALGDIVAKQRLYSEQLESFLVGRPSEPLLSDEHIISAFTKIPWFSRPLISDNLAQIRTRLRHWDIVTPQDVDALVARDDIKKIITEVYIRELKRPIDAPFDPGALAVWGGLLFRLGTSHAVVDHFTHLIRQSDEFREKHQT